MLIFITDMPAYYLQNSVGLLSLWVLI